jgi:hypothetical protein
MSSLLFTDAEYKEEQNIKTSKLIKNINIEAPARKNEFTKRKKWLFENIEKENLLESYYETAKLIFFLSADEYARTTNKSKNSLFKLRSFDKDYIRPQIEKHLIIE